MKVFNRIFGGMRPSGNEFKNMDVGFCYKSRKTFLKIRHAFSEDSFIFFRKDEVQELIDTLEEVKKLHKR